MTGAELARLNSVVRFMELHRRPKSGLWCLHTNKDTPRSTISDIQKRITRLQIEHGLRPYNVTTFETRGGLHAHIVFLGNREILERLKSSMAFGEFIKVDPVTDPVGLVRKYLAKERTPQAGYARHHMLGGRLRGSHRLDLVGSPAPIAADREVAESKPLSAPRTDPGRGRGHFAGYEAARPKRRFVIEEKA